MNHRVKREEKKVKKMSRPEEKTELLNVKGIVLIHITDEQGIVLKKLCKEIGRTRNIQTIVSITKIR